MNQRLDSAGHLMSLLVVMLLASLVTGQNVIDTLEPSDIIANEGGNASMTCEILPVGSPRIEIRPVGGGFSNVPPDRLETELVVTPEGENNRTRFIYLNVARGEDGTQFRCVYGGSTLSNTGTLDVFFAPQYTDPGDQVVREGNDFSLSIMLDLGDPEAVDFQWQFNGNNINSIARITLTINSIMITGVQQSEDGTYSVTTSNNVGPTTVDFDLDVQFPPVFTVDETCGTVVTEERLEGTDFTLNCEVSGDPTPQLTTSQPSTSSATFDTSTQQFSFTSARSEDTGTYACTATNTVDGGEETCVRTYMVTVDSLPLRVAGLDANVEDNINVVITWFFQDNEELTIMFFSVILTDSSGNQVFSANMVPVPSGNVARISVGIEGTLEINTDYIVSVTATNALGVGGPAISTFTTPAVDCGPLSIEGGEVSFSSGTTLNSTATYTCFRSFTLNGNQTRQCQESGLWSGSDPTCEVDSTTGTGTTEPSGDDDDDDDDDDIDDDDDDDDDDMEVVDIVFIAIGIGFFLLAIVIIAAALLHGCYIRNKNS